MFIALDFTTQPQLSSQAVFPSSSPSPHTILFPNCGGHHQTNASDPLQKEKPHVQNPPGTSCWGPAGETHPHQGWVENSTVKGFNPRLALLLNSTYSHYSSTIDKYLKHLLSLLYFSKITENQRADSILGLVFSPEVQEGNLIIPQRKAQVGKIWLTPTKFTEDQ